MTVSGSVPISSSWPLAQQARQFELGLLLSCAVIDAVPPPRPGELGVQHAGCWECDLADCSLLWSGGVYDIFGLPRSLPISREETLALYCEDSRARMERLRSDAIKHRRGFTLDVRIKPVAGATERWMRLIGLPVCDAGVPVRLHGLKLII